MTIEQWVAILFALGFVSKLVEWTLRYRFRREAMRGFRAMQHLGGRRT